MPIYSCPRCGYSSHIKTYLRKHFLRKKPCSQSPDLPTIEECFKEVLGEKFEKSAQRQPKRQPCVSQNVSRVSQNVSHVSPNIYICKHCKKKYNHRQSKHKHEKICKLRNKKVEEKEINKLLKEKEELKRQHAKEIEQLLEKIDSSRPITNNITNNIENQQINIHINSYGNENLDYLTTDFINELIKIPYASVPKLIRYIHFNPAHPENHNVKIPNKKEKYALVHKDGSWKYTNKRDLIESMVDTGYNILDCHMEGDKLIVHSSKRNNFEEFQKKYDGEKKIRKKVYEATELEILNGQGDKKKIEAIEI